MRTDAGEGGVSEGDGLIGQACDACAVGGISGVEVCGCTGESGDGAGIDGDGGLAIESVERRCINGCVRDGDGVGVAGFSESIEGGEITLGDGGGDNAGGCSSEGVGLSGGGGAAAVDGFIAKACDA